ncbi:M23 family metallopeptidase [bacterium]|nr:M23 family metallopeptidase [bacterium]
MPTKHGLTIFFVPHNRKDSVSIRLKGWHVIAVTIILGISIILFLIGVLLGGRSAKLIAENRAIKAENEMLRQQRVKILKLEKELATTSELRKWMQDIVSVKENNENPPATANTSKIGITSLLDSPFKSRLLPELDEASEAIRRRRDFVPKGLPAKGAITAHFGDMDSRFLKPHSGVDIASAEGSDVLATATGVVSGIISDPVLGNAVEIDHLNGFVTRDGHMKAIIAKHASWIERGDKIGTVGSSGRTEGAHVHYVVTKDGVPVNPEEENEKINEKGQYGKNGS